eukprot:scaffold1339_cov207-Alexandrium_tamarense.AAC.9
MTSSPWNSSRRRGSTQQQQQHVHLAVVATFLLVCSSVSSFAPSPFLAFTSTQQLTPSSTYCETHANSQRRVHSIVLMAKKRRKKSSSDDADEIKLQITTTKESATENKQTDNGDIATDSKSSISKSNGDTTTTQPPKQTLSGGPSLIFEMARRMLVWDDDLYQGLNDRSDGGESTPTTLSPSELALPSTTIPASLASTMPTALPRWRPSAILQQSISNVNPSFRTASPIMTNAGYAGILRRNSRKKRKPSMWRHCLRVYNKMAELENGEDEVISDNVGAGSRDGNATRSKKKPRIKRSTAHHEAALVATSKLAMWEEAVKIYRKVEESSATKNALASNARNDGMGSYPRNSPSAGVNTTQNAKDKSKNGVTDNMVLSVINACVKGSRVKQTTSQITVGAIVNSNVTSSSANVTSKPPVSPPPSRSTLRWLAVDERRRPLDAARNIVLTMEDKHDIPLVSHHVNPLAAAYLRIGLRAEAAELINHLNDRNPPPPPTPTYKRSSWKEKRELTLTSDNPGFEGVQLVNWSDEDADSDDELDDVDDFAGYEEAQLNIHEVQSKDRGSYSLLVQGAVMDEDWAGAVRELQRMTEVGLHPNSRNLNSWSEVMERGSRPGGKGNNDELSSSGGYYNGRRRRRGLKKKRDGIWLRNLR